VPIVHQAARGYTSTVPSNPWCTLEAWLGPCIRKIFHPFKAWKVFQIVAPSHWNSSKTIWRNVPLGIAHHTPPYYKHNNVIYIIMLFCMIILSSSDMHDQVVNYETVLCNSIHCYAISRSSALRFYNEMLAWQFY